MDKKMREIEKRNNIYQLFFDHSPALMAVTSIEDGKFVEVNQAFLDTLGYRKDEVIGKTSEELEIFSDIGQLNAVKQQLYDIHHIHDVALKLNRRDGTNMEGLFSGEVISFEGQLHFMTVMLDVTERNRLIESIQAQKTFLTAVIDAIPDVIFIKDENSQYIGCNQAFAQKIIQGDKSHAIGKIDEDLFENKEVADFNRQQDLQIMKSKETRINYKKMLTNEGFIEYETIKTPIYNELGKVNGIIGIARDISLRKQMEEKIRKSEERFKQLAGIFPETIFECDLDGMITYANDHAYECYGYSKEEVSNGINVLELVEEKDREIVYQKILSKLQGGDQKYLEFMAIRKDGTTFPAMGFAAPIFDNGEAVGLRGFILDNSEQKQNEIELVQAKELAETANILKSRFLATMSHEIRTPMNGIMGFLELLSRSDLSSYQQEYIREAKSASEMLLYLINDILDFSKIEAGKLNIEQIKFKLRTTVEDAVGIFMPRADEKKINLHVLIKSNVPDELIGDPARLRQILNNLISNAIKFTSEGEVNIRVDCSGRSNGNAIVNFEVTDTGIGLSQESMDKLFTPFVQADASTTRKYGGTGLGLAISKELVKLMGGEISLESRQGAGSTFRFTIPFGIGKKSKKQHSLHDLKGITILIVDDHGSNRKIMLNYLKETGCKVIEANGPAEAIGAFLSDERGGESIDCAILDYQMPTMNGFQLAATLKTLPTAYHTKLIMLTSVGEKGDVGEAKKHGFSGYIPKPIRRDEMLQCILMVLGLRTFEDEATPIITRYTINEQRQALKPKILLAEDNEMNRKIMVRMLALQGWSCDIAVDGLEALEAVKQHQYDIVFMDCQMPVMDGYESTAGIREFEGNNKHTTIVALTANAMEGDRQKALDAGMDDYLSKPINFDAMFDMIRGVFYIDETNNEHE